MRANIPKGLGGGPQNMQALMRQVQKAQEEVAQKQEELDAREYDISAGGGVVTVKINGKREILAIDLKPEIVDPDDIETLSDILVAAVNEHHGTGQPAEHPGTDVRSWRNTLNPYRIWRSSSAD